MQSSSELGSRWGYTRNGSPWPCLNVIQAQWLFLNFNERSKLSKHDDNETCSHSNRDLKVILCIVSRAPFRGFYSVEFSAQVCDEMLGARCLHSNIDLRRLELVPGSNYEAMYEY